MNGNIKKTKDLKIVSTNISVFFLRPSMFENGLRKETEISIETNFRSFVFLFYHSKMLLLDILFANIRLYIILDHSPIVPRYSVTKALNSLTPTTALRERVVYSSGFPKGKRVTDDYSILAQEALVFPKDCCTEQY